MKNLSPSTFQQDVNFTFPSPNIGEAGAQHQVRVVPHEVLHPNPACGHFLPQAGEGKSTRISKCVKHIQSAAKYLRTLLLATLIFFTGLHPAAAIIVDDLYTVELTASDTTGSERQLLLRKGFDQILEKLTGTANILTEPRIKAAKEQIDKYVTSFAYKDQTEGIAQVKIVFNETMLNSLLQASAKNYLGKNRPIILVWLALDTGKGFKLIGEEEHATLLAPLEQIAAKHSIPLVLPLFDLDELTKIKVADVVNGAPVLLETAAKYHADVVLLGKIKNIEHGWQGQWQILSATTTNSQMQTSGKTVADQYRQLMRELTLSLINRYNAVPDKIASNVVKVRISGVNSLENYAKILTYLRNLSNVSMVEVVDINSDGATFELRVEGGEDAVKKALSMDRILEQAAAIDGNASSAVPALHYRVCS